MIYGIFSGKYSDWNVCGYFEDAETAHRYCKLKNKNADDYDKLYVIPINEIKISGKLPTIKKYSAGFNYWVEMNTLMIDEDSIQPAEDDEKSHCFASKNKTMLYGRVVAPRYDMDAFEKIALDMIAKYKEENEICN